MPIVLRMTPGSNNADWPKFYENGCIGTFRHDTLNYTNINSLEEIEKHHPNRDLGSARTILDFKNAPNGSFVVVGNSSSKFIGIGVLNGDYIYTSFKERPEGLKSYPHLRKVHWLSNMEVSFDEPLFTVDAVQVLDSSAAKRIIAKYKDAGVALPDSDEMTINNEIEVSIEVAKLLNLTQYTRNIILYGPPGTGKTFTVHAFRQHFLSNLTAKLEEANNLNSLLRWQAIALTLYHAGADEALSVNAMLDLQPLARYEAQRASKSPYASVMTELIERGLDGEGQPVNAKYQRTPAIFLKLPNKTWTLSEQGRRHVEAHLLAQSKADWSAAPESRTAFVTFHPSFAYEEFVEGLRPVTDDEGQLTYPIRDGVFKRICHDAEQELHAASAAQREVRPFLLVIDEINRANIAKVFGELMTLIEDDKRVTADGRGLRVTLPYSGESFGVPENLYIVGTMNTADRSIALLDLALRRRFTFLEVLPDPEVIRQTSGENGVVDGVDVAALLEALNRRLRVMLDRDHQMGHSYLTGVTRGLDELHFRWYRKVIPLLQEYFYNDGQKLLDLLGPAFIQVGQRVGGLGGRLDYDVVDQTGAAFRSALQQLCKAKPQAAQEDPSPA